MKKNENRKFKAVVIDDNKMRNETYKKVLGAHFNVTIINDMIDIVRDEIIKNDILILDVCLSPPSTEATAFKVINDYDLSLPTVLVSSEWVDKDKGPKEYILDVVNYKNIIKVINWNDFNQNDSNTQIGEEIFYQFCKAKNLLISNHATKFSILHLSDLQFGGSTAGSSLNDSYRIAQCLKDENIKPEIIVVTGDIADKGKETEYKEACDWLESLIRKIWNINGEIEEKFLKKVIMVPGNHDYDLSISASDYYDFVFNADEKGTFVKKENTYTNQKIGFYNFTNFAYKFSKDISWLFYMNKAVHINDIFKDWGIRFITLNSAYNINSDNCENRFGQFYCDLSAFKENALNSDESADGDMCNVLVMHNPPSNFKQETKNGNKSWERLKAIIEDNKISLIMSGHTHEAKPTSRLSEGGGKYCKSAVCVSAPCARLEAALRTEDAPRGFNVIEFYQEKGKIKKIKPRYFSMQGASINEVTDDRNTEDYYRI